MDSRIFAIIGLIAVIIYFSFFVTTQTEGFSCYGLDERNCMNTPYCGWCVDNEGLGRCKNRNSPKYDCFEWRSSHPFVVPEYWSYAGPYWSDRWAWGPRWRRPRPWVWSRDYRKKIARLRKGGW